MNSKGVNIEIPTEILVLDDRQSMSQTHPLWWFGWCHVAARRGAYWWIRELRFFCTRLLSCSRVGSTVWMHKPGRTGSK